jgi:hypothetical protein
LPQWQQILAGNDATYHNVGSNRTINTTFTNTNGRPIYVIANAAITVEGTLAAIVNGVMLPEGDIQAGGTSSAAQISFIVPTGATYEIIIPFGSGILANWFELF